MTQYINKDKAIAEIEKAVDEPAPSHDQQCSWEDGYYGGLYKAESIIENLEVKEVDLEKELVDYHNDNFNPCSDGTLISCETGAELAWCDYERIAKFFFELGLKVGNKAQKGE